VRTGREQAHLQSDEAAVESGLLVTCDWGHLIEGRGGAPNAARAHKALVPDRKRVQRGSMRRITFGGASFLTADRIGDALVALLVILNVKNSSAVARIPVVLINGTIVTATLLLAPASPFMIIPEESPWPEPDAAETITHLSNLEDAASALGQNGYLETIAVPDCEWSDPDLNDL